MVLGAGAIAYLAACSWLGWQQAHFLYLPFAELQTTPNQLNLSFETVELPIGTGDAAGTLHGWWLPNPDATQVLLYLHGNGGNISVNLAHAQRFYNMGFSVLLMDYRGYGQSSGPFPSETRLYEDAAAFWQYLTIEQGFSPEQIVVYGHSLGGAIAIELATQQPDMAALIVQSSFTSMREVIRSTWYEQIFPIDLLLNQIFDSIGRVSQLQMPVFYIHGDSDTTIPAEMSQQLYDATASPKVLWIVPTADHNNLASIVGDEYPRRIQLFLSKQQQAAGDLP